MDHMQYLMLRAHNPENQTFHHPQENPDDAEHEHCSGHSRMLTAVPLSHVMEKPGEKYPYQPFNASKAALAKLLKLSGSLPVNDDLEITPIRAWYLIGEHPRVGELDQNDFAMIASLLGNKVRCYGFGAVLERWEMEDALETTFANKAMPSLTVGIAHQMIMSAA